MLHLVCFFRSSALGEIEACCIIITIVSEQSLNQRLGTYTWGGLLLPSQIIILRRVHICSSPLALGTTITIPCHLHIVRSLIRSYNLTWQLFVDIMVHFAIWQFASSKSNLKLVFTRNQLEFNIWVWRRDFGTHHNKLSNQTSSLALEFILFRSIHARTRPNSRERRYMNTKETHDIPAKLGSHGFLMYLLPTWVLAPTESYFTLPPTNRLPFLSFPEWR